MKIPASAICAALMLAAVFAAAWSAVSWYLAMHPETGLPPILPLEWAAPTTIASGVAGLLFFVWMVESNDFGND